MSTQIINTPTSPITWRTVQLALTGPTSQKRSPLTSGTTSRTARTGVMRSTPMPGFQRPMVQLPTYVAAVLNHPSTYIQERTIDSSSMKSRRYPRRTIMNRQSSMAFMIRSQLITTTYPRASFPGMVTSIRSISETTQMSLQAHSSHQLVVSIMGPKENGSLSNFTYTLLPSIQSTGEENVWKCISYTIQIHLNSKAALRLATRYSHQLLEFFSHQTKTRRRSYRTLHKLSLRPSSRH